MSIAELAKNFHAEHRGNCAMSVAYAFARASGKTEKEAVESAEMFRNFGGGRAPNGTCGALYAAMMMQPDHVEALEAFFRRGAKGFTHCKEIRPMRLSRATAASNWLARHWTSCRNRTPPETFHT